MAELERLGAIVAAARAAADARAAGGPAFLFLLDEMLQGTNSAERTIAARRVIGHLVGAGAIGAVTTHDLALADPPPDGARADAAARLAWTAAVPVHFAEQVGGTDGRVAMTFDYRMRDGVATSTNALRLLEIVGL
jgi:DNA mismatch repair ATPase MutS